MSILKKSLFLVCFSIMSFLASGQNSYYKDLFVRPDLSPTAGSDTTKMYFQMLVNVDSVYSGSSINMLIGSAQDSADVGSYSIPAMSNGSQQYYPLNGTNFYVNSHFLWIGFTIPKNMVSLVAYMTVYSTDNSNNLNSNKLYYKF